MDRTPLPRSVRQRALGGGVGVAVLALLFVPLEIATVTSDRAGAGLRVSVFVIGIGLPAVLGLLIWRQVRRLRSDPDLLRRQPNRAATRVLRYGNMGVLVIALASRHLVGTGGWKTWVVFGGVALVGSVLVVRWARHYDPRIHYFRRPDPLPEGQEPDEGPAPPPW
ncbi:MAG: hypothetical protein ACTHNS_05565 [Marmoricola sp.]